MHPKDAVIAIYSNHNLAELAVKKLASEGFDMKHLSVVGQGYHTEEKVVGFYNVGNRVKFWGGRGAFWGGLWSLLFGGVFITIPMFGPVMVLGYLAATVITVVEGAIVVGGLSALGAALYNLGIPRDSVIDYEISLKADDFLVMAHGSAEEVAKAKAILADTKSTQISTHKDMIAPSASGRRETVAA